MKYPVREGSATARCSAGRLDMRDSSTPDGPEFARRHAGQHHGSDPGNLIDRWSPWADPAAETIGRSVVMRRVRIVPEPVAEFLLREREFTFANVVKGEGEMVRRPPRRRAADIAPPGTDLWMVDGSTELSTNICRAGEVMNLECRAVSARATPHDNDNLA